ncbi:MAG: L,D-transpeptidase family protein, partial [Stellaceae bacterium]
MQSIDLAYANGRLAWPAGSARAACGTSGVRAAKREGDGASPAGTFPLLDAYYRPDRLARPQTGLPLGALRADMGWADDPADRNYNRLVTLPCPAHHETLWREDGIYNLIVVIGYNTGPV